MSGQVARHCESQDAMTTQTGVLPEANGKAIPSGSCGVFSCSHYAWPGHLPRNSTQTEAQSTPACLGAQEYDTL